MKNKLFAILFLGITGTWAQSPGNALNFDGNNDNVSTALPAVFNNIASNSFTIETWIKPNGNNFSRAMFAQLNTNEFTSISISSTRQVYFYVGFIGGTGINTTNTLPIGIWAHVACTWDASAGVALIYINGVLQATTGGGSSSVGSNNVMTIGTKTDGSQGFVGELDELRIWDDVRTDCEIAGGMTSEYTVAQSNLVAYYNFNNGVAGGTNTGVTTLSDFTGSYDGTLNNFTLSGTLSNWVASGASITGVNQNPGFSTIDVQTSCGPIIWIDGNTYTSNNNTATFLTTTSGGCDSLVTLDLTIASATAGTDVQTSCSPIVWIDGNTYTTSNNTATYNIVGGSVSGCDSLVTLDLTIASPAAGTDTQTACDTYVWIDGNTYTASNNTATYTVVGGALNGCDSIVTLDLTIVTLNTNVTQAGPLLTADEVGATYQWLDCDGMVPIGGATNQSYTATLNGDFAVMVANNGCTDTSACYTVTGIGIMENDFGNDLLLYPNPTNGDFSIDLGKNHTATTLTIADLKGRIVHSEAHISSQLLNVQLNEPAGIYVVTILSKDKKAVIRLVKQ